MRVTSLSIDHCWCFEPAQHRDERGIFLEIFNQDSFAAATGHPLQIRQTNCSISVRGAIRGVHFSDVPPGQAKYVSCTHGAVWDVAVDVRRDSPTYGKWDAVRLDDVDRAAVYLAEGIGHGFMALTDNATVVYASSTSYAPQREHGFHPFDTDVAISWPTQGDDGQPLTPVLSQRDQGMPPLRDLAMSGVLPRYQAVEAWYATLASPAGENA